MPIVVVDSTLFAWCLQRLPDLLASTAPLETKIGEAQELANKLADRFAATDKSQSALRKMFPGLYFHTQTCFAW